MKKELSRMLSVALLLTLSCVFTACSSDPDPEENITQDENNKGGNQGNNQNEDQGGGTYTGTTNGHDYVDLGLPSGTKWATCNVGASKPEDSGGYYAWGETAAKSDYEWKTYKWCSYKIKNINPHDIGSNIAGTSYDVASVMWGGGWHMPTEKQCDELIDNTTYEWTTQGGIIGKLFRGKNGGTIFLPAAGEYWCSDKFYEGVQGQYWSSTLLESPDKEAARFMEFRDGRNVVGGGYTQRCWGKSVRPVIGYLDENSSSGNPGGNSSGGGSSSESGEAPSFRDFTWTYTNTSVTVQYLTTENNTTKATVYYGKNTSPSTSVSTTVSGGHIISARITGLTKATKYYVKCVATNEYGSTTSNVMPVMTGSD